MTRYLYGGFSVLIITNWRAYIRIVKCAKIRHSIVYITPCETFHTDLGYMKGSWISGVPGDIFLWKIMRSSWWVQVGSAPFDIRRVQYCVTCKVLLRHWMSQMVLWESRTMVFKLHRKTWSQQVGWKKVRTARQFTFYVMITTSSGKSLWSYFRLLFNDTFLIFDSKCLSSIFANTKKCFPTVYF